MELIRQRCQSETADRPPHLEPMSPPQMQLSPVPASWNHRITLFVYHIVARRIRQEIKIMCERVITTLLGVVEVGDRT
jgi:hypothetical protein